MIPLVSAGLMAAFANMYFQFHIWILGMAFPDHPGVNNLIACLAAIFLSMFVYFSVLILLRGISRKEIEDMPKGKGIANILTKLHLLRE